MRDGVRLITDIYLPNPTGRFPAILARSVYDRQLGVGLAPETTRRGYAFVVQNCRGRFGSQGANRPFDTDGWADGPEDGYDTVEWIARQPWCNGKVGTWGGSALGITQYQMAGTRPPHLTCQQVIVGAPDLYAFVYPGGAFHKAMVEDWLRVSAFDPSALQEWTSHPAYDAYWKARDLSTRWSRADVPAVHIGGWYDIFTQGVIDAFNGYQTRGGTGARGRQKLVMGPWTHAVGQTHVGDVTFPAGAAAPPNHVDDAWRWYGRWLQDDINGIDRLPAVTYYVMGDTTDRQAPGNEWRTAPAWPIPSAATPYYLSADHRLMQVRPTGRGSLAYTYDPLNPVPTVGGNHLTLPAGPHDQRGVEARPDVMVFTGRPLEKPLEVTGRVRARLWVSSDAPDTDFTAKLCDVYPDGRSLNICEGILRARFRRSFSRPEPLRPDRIYPVAIDLASTSMVFNRGHRLRVQISSSSFPAYDPNPNTGARFRSDSRARVARNRVYMEPGRASCIVLPIVGGAASDVGFRPGGNPPAAARLDAMAHRPGKSS